uniref:PfkB domain-containing protein n=1 Tax=Syphacia muris TaxID=451379 RepID=A0A0N5AT95_9BILA
MFSKALQHCFRRFSSIRSNKVVILPEVQDALNSSKGVVALESTVITHGLPRPQNLKLARKLEAIVRQNDCVPATIAILNGKVHIGLTDKQLQEVAEDVNSIKVSKRDIAIAMVNNVVGGTTVAATMYLANIAGIRVFATGGLGGVHRDVSETFDISADLTELSKTPVVVVCAGVKSILDLPKTLEFLETNSVNVMVYGDSNKFPGFFTSETEFTAPFNTKSLQKIVDAVECSRSLGLENGFVVACPIPAELAADGNAIEKAIKTAISEASEFKIMSKNVTPYLLKRVSELTNGASLQTNLTLLENNAVIGAKIANLFAKRIQSERVKGESSSSENSSGEKCLNGKPKIVVVGATILDFETITQCDVKNDGGSYVGKVIHRCGGVGRNHADALTRLGNDVHFISVVGNDLFGKCFKKECAHMNLKHVVTINDIPTAVYMSCNVKGNVLYGISAIEGIIGSITPELIRSNEELINNADYVLLDGNISKDAIKTLVEIASFYKVKIWFEPTDIAKMRKIFDAKVSDAISITSPNLHEFESFSSCIGQKLPDKFTNRWKIEQIYEYVTKRSEFYLRSLDTLIITLGSEGTIILNNSGSNIDHYILPPPAQASQVVSVSGAGDW